MPNPHLAGGGQCCCKEASEKKALLYIAFALILLVFQKLSNVAGKCVADMFSYETPDPDNAYAWNFVHHITTLLIGIAVLMLAVKSQLRSWPW